MFKNLKQKVSSDQKVRTPQSTPRSGAPNTKSSGRSASATRFQTPSSRFDQPLHLASEKANGIKHGDDLDDKKVAENIDSPDVVEQTSQAVGDTSPSLSNDAGLQSLQSGGSTLASGKKASIFKRLEFLTPQKDQVTGGLSESRESITSLVEEVGRKNVGQNEGVESKPDIVSQTNERARLDSVSDTEDLLANQNAIDVREVSKEQLLSKVIRLEKTLRKCREKHSELSTTFTEAKRERDKVLTVMQQTQDKNLRRIHELREQVALDLKAKMHLEEEFTASLEEKDQLIQVLQTQVAILKGDPVKEVPSDVGVLQQTSSHFHMDKQVAVLEEQLKIAKDACEQLRKRANAVQAQLDERLEEIEKTSESNLAEKSKLIKELSEAKNIIGQIEEDKQTAVAESKRQVHEIFEGKDNELASLRDELKKLQNDFNLFRIEKEEKENSLVEELRKSINDGRTAEAAHAEVTAELRQLEKDFEDQLSQAENGFDGERKEFVYEISHLKADALKLNETIENLNRKHQSEIESHAKRTEVALSDQAKSFELQLQEKDDQMQLAIEERELNKIAAVSQQDAEAQHLLEHLDAELRAVRQKAEDLEETRLEEARKHEENLSKMKEDLQRKEEEHREVLRNLEEVSQKHLASKTKEFQENFLEQKKSFLDELQVRESSWMKKITGLKDLHSKEVQNLKSLNDKSVDDQSNLMLEQASQVSLLEKEAAMLSDERLLLSKKISDMEDSSKESQKLHEKLKCELEESERKAQIKDAMIKELSGKVESLNKDVSQKERDSLLKSEPSHSEVAVLHKDIENLLLERSDLEERCTAVEDQLKAQDAATKKHILEMENRQKNEILALASQLDMQKQEFVVKIAKLEKEKLDVQKSQEASHKKFLEAAGRLKSLAQKFKANLADHEAAMKEKNTALLEAQTSVKSCEERVKELEQINREKQADNLATLEDGKRDFERRLRFEKGGLAEKFLKEKEDLTNAMEQLKANLETKFDEDVMKMSRGLSAKFKAEKLQILKDCREKSKIEKKDLEVQLQNQCSEAAVKDKAMLQSYEDTRLKLNSAEEDNARLNKELVELRPRVAELQKELQKSLEMLENISVDDKAEKEQRTQSEIRTAVLEQELSIDASGLAGLKTQSNDSNTDEEKLQAEVKSVAEELSMKICEIETLTNLLDSKNADLENVRKDFTEQSSKFQESSVKISELEKRIQKLQSHLSDQSDEVQSLNGAHLEAIEKVNKDCGVKYATLKAKAEQKIAQQQMQLKNAKAELVSQNETVQNLGKDKMELENKIEVLKSELEMLENVKEDSATLALKLREAGDKLVKSEKACEDLKNELDVREQTQCESVEALEKKLETVSEALQFTQSLVKNLKAQLDESKNKLKALNALSEEKVKALSDSQSECERLKADLYQARSLSESSQTTLTGKDAEMQKLLEKLVASDAQIQLRVKEIESLKEEECKRQSSLLVQNEEMAKSLQKMKKEAAEKEASLVEEIAIVQEESKIKIQEEAARLAEKSEMKCVDLKKKAELRLAQIKKTFTTQLEEKLKIISQLQEDKTAMEENLASCNVEKEKSDQQSDSKDEKLKQLQEEVKRLQEEKIEIEFKLRVDSEQAIQNALDEERIRYNGGQRQLTDLKERLEQVLQETKLKMEEENNRAVAAVQEETDKRVQSEARLAVALEDFEKKEEIFREKQGEFNAKIVAFEDGLNAKEDELQKAVKVAAEQAATYNNQLEAARKRSEKLERNREAMKQDLQEAILEHRRQMQSLKDEVNSAEKQVEVLSKTAVEDADVEVERKLGSLKEDFDRRLREKEEEMARRIKKLMFEYESQIQRNNEEFDERIEKMRQKNLSFEDSVRSQHHKELVLLQREIIAKEKKMEETVEKYESEMHETEKEMSDKVDKAMYRAMTAEKRLQECDYERENETLKNQVTELNKALEDMQLLERENANTLQSLEAKVAKSTPLADPDKLEYLRKVLYEYIMGNQPVTMIKVLIILLQFKDLESQQILEKHGLTQK